VLAVTLVVVVTLLVVTLVVVAPGAPSVVTLPVIVGTVIPLTMMQVATPILGMMTVTVSVLVVILVVTLLVVIIGVGSVRH